MWVGYFSVDFDTFGEQKKKMFGELCTYGTTLIIVIWILHVCHDHKMTNNKVITFGGKQHYVHPLCPMSLNGNLLLGEIFQFIKLTYDLIVIHIFCFRPGRVIGIDRLDL